MYDDEDKDVFNKMTLYWHIVIYNLKFMLVESPEVWKQSKVSSCILSAAQKKHVMYESVPRLLLHLPLESHSRYLFLPVIK